MAESSDHQTKKITEFCHAYQADDLDIIPDSNEDDDPRFFIKFKVEFRYPSALPLFDETYKRSIVQFDLDSIISYHHFWEKCSKESGEILPWTEVSKILTKIRIPLHKQPFILHQITKCAKEMANLAGNRGLKVFPMMVSIGIFTDYLCFDIQESSFLATKESPNFATLSEAARAANELEIDALQKKVVGNGEMKCMICMENAEAGCEVLSVGMPLGCSHYYHGDCLLRWLEIANFCPHCCLD